MLLSFTIEEHNVKNFMNRLLRETLFDAFELRAAEIVAQVWVSVSGENEEKHFSNWGQIKPLITAIIKSGPKPRQMKFVFSADADATAKYLNAQALFINMVYEGSQITFTTACSQKQFSMDKSLDTQWDSYVITFFKNNNIQIKREE